MILAHGRADLDAKLGRFPYDQKEALRRAKQWKDATPVARLGLMRDWTRQFHDEYRHLREEPAWTNR